MCGQHACPGDDCFWQEREGHTPCWLCGTKEPSPSKFNVWIVLMFWNFCVPLLPVPHAQSLPDAKHRRQVQQLSVILLFSCRGGFPGISAVDGSAYSWDQLCGWFPLPSCPGCSSSSFLVCPFVWQNTSSSHFLIIGRVGGKIWDPVRLKVSLTVF